MNADEENGNSLKAKGFWYHPKLWWAGKLDLSTRANALAGFSKRYLPGDDQKQWERIAKKIA